MKINLWAVITLLLFGISSLKAQIIWVDYTLVGAPADPDDDLGFITGQKGKIAVIPGMGQGTGGQKWIPLNSFALTPIVPWSPLGTYNVSPVIAFSDVTNCAELHVTEGGGLFLSNRTLYVDHDGWPALLGGFYAAVGMAQYSGWLRIDACNNCLPADTNFTTIVQYEPPGTNLALPGPLTWDLIKNPCGAGIKTNGWYKAVLRAGPDPGTIRIRATGTNGCFVEKDVTIGDCEGGCSGTCSSPQSAGPTFGEGNVALSSVDFRLSLGTTWEGKSAGFLRAHFSEPTVYAYQAKSFKYLFDPLGILVVPVNYDPLEADVAVQQIKTPHGLVTVNDFGTGYTVNFCPTVAMDSGISDGLYHCDTDQNLVTWTVQNPSPGTSNQIQITKTPKGQSAITWTYRWITNGWSLTHPDGSVQTLISTQVASGVAFEARSTYAANEDLVAFTGKHFRSNSLGGPVTHEIRGLGSDARTNTFSYYTNGLLQYVIHEDGFWEYYVYDELQRPTNIFSAFGNQSVTNNKSYCRLTEHSYETSLVNVGTNSGDAGVFSSMSPRRTFEYLLDQPVSLTYHTYIFGETRDIQCVSTNAAWNDGANLVTIRKWYTNGFYYGQPLSIERPDGTMDFFEYTGDPNNPTGTVTVVSSGAPNSGKTAIVDGTRTVTVKGPVGQLVSVTTTDVRSSIITARQLYGAYDDYSRPQATTNLDGTWEFSQKFCCGDILTTNREGTVTTKTYDALNRLVTTTTAGITMENGYDAAGNMTHLWRIGTNGNTIPLQHNEYNTAGERTRAWDALSQFRDFGQFLDASSQLIITNFVSTNSSLGVNRVETHYRDGQLKSITGGLVHPGRYEYGAASGGTFTREIKLDANGADTSEVTTNFFDLLERPYKTTYADGAFSQTFYNSAGQVSKTVDPDGVAMLYRYNARGERSHSVLDMNRDDGIDWGGPDRITLSTNYYTTNSTHRSETYAWLTDADTPTLMSVNESTVTGLTSWDTRNGVVSRMDTVYSGGMRWITNTAPDGSRTETRFDYGRVTSTTRKDNTGSQVMQTSFGYDEHGRQKFVVDGRNGTNTYTFDDLDRNLAFTTPVPGAGQSAQSTGYRFDALGRIVTVTNADTQLLYKDYFDSGELKSAHGAREYPVEYTYDAQGRMKTMKTWQQYLSEPTAAVTGWTNDLLRGWLNTKGYADGKGPSYSYTPAGRLSQKTWARGTTTSYAMNAFGDIERITYSDNTGNITNTYDRRGRVIGINHGSNITTRLYHQSGVLLSETQNGIVVSNRYDEQLRRTNVSLVVNGTVVASTGYSYDTAGRLATVTDGTNNATYSYVANSPLVSQIVFASNSTPRMTTMKSYDYLNRLTLITNYVPGAGAESPAFAYALNSANQRIGITNFGGTSPTHWLFSYDSLGQVTNGTKRWSDGSLVLGQQFAYAFDDIGNRKAATSGGDVNGNHLRLQTYAANNLNQYTSRTVPGYLDIIGSATNTATVAVNNVTASRKGNYYRAEVGVPNGGPVWQSITNTAALASGTNDIVTSYAGNLFVPQTPERFTFDLDGNQTSDGRWTNSWDAENQLVTMTSHASAPSGSRLSLKFGYDSQHRRISKVVSNWTGSTWTKAYEQKFACDAWNVVAILNESNALQVSFHWGTDASGTMHGDGGVGGLISMTVHTGIVAGVYFYAYDGNHNVSALISAADGTIAALYEYDPFHRLLRATGPLAFVNPFLAATKFYDWETGLYYYGYRYYDSISARWLSRDPLGEVSGKNIYCFLDNRANLMWDYLGLCKKGDCEVRFRRVFERNLSSFNLQNAAGGDLGTPPQEIIDELRDVLRDGGLDALAPKVASKVLGRIMMILTADKNLVLHWHFNFKATVLYDLRHCECKKRNIIFCCTEWGWRRPETRSIELKAEYDAEDFIVDWFSKSSILPTLTKEFIEAADAANGVLNSDGTWNGKLEEKIQELVKRQKLAPCENVKFVKTFE